MKDESIKQKLLKYKSNSVTPISFEEIFDLHVDNSGHIEIKEFAGKEKAIFCTAKKRYGKKIVFKSNGMERFIDKNSLILIDPEEY